MAEDRTTEGLRRANTALVLRTLRDQGAASRADLATRTGLSKATVGVIAAALDEAGALVAASGGDGGGAGAPPRGRPGRPVALAGEGHVGLGFELNVDYVAASVVDLAGHERLRTTRAVTRGQGLDDLARLAGEVSRTLSGSDGGGARVVGATVAVPGLVRADERTVAWTPNLHLPGAEPARTLDEALGGRIEVRVGNDADCAARAEAHHGAARHAEHALYITGTVGIGAGILQHGRPLRGGAGFAGEVGHLPLAGERAPCGCGRRGCWEAAVGLRAMLAAVGMEELATPTASAEAVAARAAGDPGVRDALARIGELLGRGLAMLVTVLDPEVVVLGGYFATLGDHVIAPARRTLDQQLASPVQVRPELRPGALGINAAAIGAAERSLEPLFGGEVALEAVPRYAPLAAPPD